MHTGGHSHVGFVTSLCIHHLSDLNGVGDTALSVAFDGHRSCKWTRNKSVPFGENWAPGDVVACALDLDNGHVEFFLNGVSLGVAFASLPRSGLVYYPALSLAHAERCTLNFGALPLQFVYRNSQTQRLYQAVEPPPPAASVGTAEFLAAALERICTATVNPAHCRPDPPQDLMGLCDKILGIPDWTEQGHPPASNQEPRGPRGRGADAASGAQRLWAKGFSVSSWAVQATEAVTGPLLAVVLAADASAHWRYLTQVSLVRLLESLVRGGAGGSAGEGGRLGEGAAVYAIGLLGIVMPSEVACRLWPDVWELLARRCLQCRSLGPTSDCPEPVLPCPLSVANVLGWFVKCV